MVRIEAWGVVTCQPLPRKKRKRVRQIQRTRVNGERGIRTLDTRFHVCRFSKPVPSASRPSLQEVTQANEACGPCSTPNEDSRHAGCLSGGLWEKAMTQPAELIRSNGFAAIDGEEPWSAN